MNNADDDMKWWYSAQSSVRMLHLQSRFRLNSIYRVQNVSGAHQDSYPVGTRVSYSGCKMAVAWSWPLTAI
jgi:hypothetical protein